MITVCGKLAPTSLMLKAQTYIPYWQKIQLLCVRLFFFKWGQKVLLQWYFVQNFQNTKPCYILVWFGLNPSIILMTCLYVSQCHPSSVPLCGLLLWVDLHSKMAFHMECQSEWQLLGPVIRAVIVTSLLLYVKKFWSVQIFFFGLYSSLANEQDLEVNMSIIGCTPPVPYILGYFILMFL